MQHNNSQCDSIISLLSRHLVPSLYANIILIYSHEHRSIKRQILIISRKRQSDQAYTYIISIYVLPVKKGKRKNKHNTYAKHINTSIITMCGMYMVLVVFMCLESQNSLYLQ